MFQSRNLGRRAISSDVFSSEPIGDFVSPDASLIALWDELCRGECRVVDGYFTDEQCYLMTQPTQGALTPLADHQRSILEGVLLRGSQKVVAIDMGLAPSTVALNARLALGALGARSTASRVHPVLVVALRAARGFRSRCTVSTSFATSAEVQTRVFSMARPDVGFEHALPAGEFAVARHLVEGACYAEIARRRGTSKRTVANQIASVFRRLKVSGRAELLLYLLAPNQVR